MGSAASFSGAAAAKAFQGLRHSATRLFWRWATEVTVGAAGASDAKIAEAMAAQQQQQGRPRPRSYAEHVQFHIGDAVAMKIGFRVADGLEHAAWAGWKQATNVYHWAWPTRPEHVRRAALFSRREITDFVNKAAIEDGAQHIMLQAHRVNEKLRQQLVRDGFDVTEAIHMKQPAVRISWEDKSKKA